MQQRQRSVMFVEEVPKNGLKNPEVRDKEIRKHTDLFK